MPEINRALDQIAQIHDQLAVTREFGGLRAVPALSSGVVGLLAAALEPLILDPMTERGFLVYWSVVAGICLVIGGSGLLASYLRDTSEISRGQIRAVSGQFAPTLLVGALVAVAASQWHSLPVAATPGLWSMIFGLGVFATRTLLPRAIGWVALYYVAVGGALLALISGPVPSGWSVGGVFGIGQIAAGLVMFRNLERRRP